MQMLWDDVSLVAHRLLGTQDCAKDDVVNNIKVISKYLVIRKIICANGNRFNSNYAFNKLVKLFTHNDVLT